MLTLEEVRAYVRVPATALTDADLARMIDTCRADQIARCKWDYAGAIIVAATTDMTATIAGAGLPVGTIYRIMWGDGGIDPAIGDENGDLAPVQHTYAAAGDYPARVLNIDEVAVAAAIVTVPGDAAAVDITHTPAALDQALLRRIQREIAARNLPLGMVGVDAAEYGPERLPYFDALVEEHERAYRRVVLA